MNPVAAWQAVKFPARVQMLQHANLPCRKLAPFSVIVLVYLRPAASDKFCIIFIISGSAAMGDVIQPPDWRGLNTQKVLPRSKVYEIH